ncbi:glycosyltransferase family 1 protein, partial [Acinetobacter baumannii]
DLANGIEYLIRNPDFALQLAQQAKKEALEKYCFEQIAKEHNNFIHDVYKFYRK